MKKQILAIIIIAVMLLSVPSYADSKITVYAPDGRTATIYSSQLQAWKNVGWYDYPVTRMYTPDGRTAVISKNAVESWKNVGWYDYPVVKVYAPDGRTAVISKNALQSWKSVGWYDYPVTTMYAPDGRTAVINSNQVQAWINVGWYTYQPELRLPITSPMTYIFTSGVGAWETELTLYADGTFTGQFHDSNMGETGYGYPNGTVYISNFSGKFGNIRIRDEYSYSMSLESLYIDTSKGDSWIKNGVLYCVSEAYGISNGEEFIFYKAGTPSNLIPFEMRLWYQDWSRYSNSYMPYSSIYNATENYGFFHYNY